MKHKEKEEDPWNASSRLPLRASPDKRKKPSARASLLSRGLTHETARPSMCAAERLYHPAAKRATGFEPATSSLGKQHNRPPKGTETLIVSASYAIPTAFARTAERLRISARNCGFPQVARKSAEACLARCYLKVHGRAWLSLQSEIEFQLSGKIGEARTPARTRTRLAARSR
jgi:hypothetical protein